MTAKLTGAVCARPGADPDLWFPAGYSTDLDRLQAEEAKALCHRCPVEAACLRDALAAEFGKSRENRFGVRGGCTPAERAGTQEPRSGRAPRHGTVTGHRAHLAADEEPCPQCREAERQRLARWQASNRAAKCGTKAGYKRHIARHETACPACKEAIRLARVAERAANRLTSAA